MPGPLPTKDPARRNKRTIPTTRLPISGRDGPIPDLPAWLELGDAGRAWWDWAWTTPQAVGWGTGAGQEVVVARRASLEDDLATLASVDSLDLLDVLEEHVASKFKAVIQRLAALSGGRLAVCREIRELDTKLGLTPHALAALRWEIVPDEVERPARVAAAGGSARDRLTVVGA